jgi:ABC-2 type transport system permease protein
MANVALWELKSFFLRPMTYALLLSLTVVSTWSFSWLVTLLARGSAPAMRGDEDPVFQFIGPNLFLVGTGTLLIPLLTMSLVAEERRRGTWETLLTSAANPLGVVGGKFLAGWCKWLVCLTPWAVLSVVLRLWSGEVRQVAGFVPWFAGQGLNFDVGPVAGGLLGLAMLGMTFVALGLLCSSVCRQTASAAALSFAAMLGVLFLSVLPKLLGFWNCPSEWLRWAASVSCWGQLEQFSQGAVSPRIIVGHFSVCVLLLWGTTLTARSRDAS